MAQSSSTQSGFVLPGTRNDASTVPRSGTPTTEAPMRRDESAGVGSPCKVGPSLSTEPATSLPEPSASLSQHQPAGQLGPPHESLAPGSLAPHLPEVPSHGAIEQQSHKSPRAQTPSPPNETQSGEYIELPPSDDDENSDSDSETEDDENSQSQSNPNKLWEQGRQAGKRAVREEKAKKAKLVGKGKWKEASSIEHLYGHFSTAHKIAVSEMVERHTKEMMEYCQANNLDPIKVRKHADGHVPNHAMSAWQAFQQCRGFYRGCQGTFNFISLETSH